MREFIPILIRFVILALVQGTLLINLGLFDGMMQLNLYLLFIILLPLRTIPSITMGAALVIGLAVDAFYNSAGLHASAIVFAAFIRPSVLRALTPREDYEVTDRPRIADLGLFWFLRYASILCLAHALWLYLLERFSFTAMGTTLLKATLSAIFTLVVIVILNYLFGGRRSSST